jgi:hypothetical protein
MTLKRFTVEEIERWLIMNGNNQHAPVYRKLMEVLKEKEFFDEQGFYTPEEYHELSVERDVLVAAVKAVYYAAHWIPDRPVDSGALWTNLRDAAGFEAGNAPEPIKEVVDVVGQEMDGLSGTSCNLEQG